MPAGLLFNLKILHDNIFVPPYRVFFFLSHFVCVVCRLIAICVD